MEALILYENITAARNIASRFNSHIVVEKFEYRGKKYAVINSDSIPTMLIIRKELGVQL